MVKIIAEIGWNHMGDMELAKKMISSAALNGANIAKFQTWSESDLISGPWDNDGRREIYKKAELSEKDHFELKNECENSGVEFLTSVFNVKHIKFLQTLNMNLIKIPSHEIYNTDLIEHAGSKFNFVLLSVGACTYQELIRAVELVPKEKLILMHCVSSYPLAPENVNLPKIDKLKTLSNILGYSGHLTGIEDAIAAICKGATFIEKHFTIDQNLPGRDNKNAILPKDLKNLSEFRDIFDKMNTDKGLDVQEVELDIFNNYRGRWINKN